MAARRGCICELFGIGKRLVDTIRSVDLGRMLRQIPLLSQDVDRNVGHSFHDLTNLLISRPGKMVELRLSVDCRKNARRGVLSRQTAGEGFWWNRLFSRLAMFQGCLLALDKEGSSLARAACIWFLLEIVFCSVGWREQRFPSRGLRRKDS